jgi:hypothetical protein
MEPEIIIITLITVIRMIMFGSRYSYNTDLTNAVLRVRTEYLQQSYLHIL